MRAPPEFHRRFGEIKFWSWDHFGVPVQLNSAGTYVGTGAHGPDGIHWAGRHSHTNSAGIHPMRATGIYRGQISLYISG